MSSRRVVILVASIGVALLAGVGLLTYVNNSGGGSSGGGGETATVFVADVAIAEDTTVSAARGTLREIEVGSDIIPDDAIRTPEQLDRIGEQVARAPVSAGQFITSSQFVAPASKASAETATKQLVDPQNVLISIPSDEVKGVGFLLEPGDYVNLYLKSVEFDAAALDAAGNPVQLANSDEFFLGAFGQPLFQKARVASVGLDTGAPEQELSVEQAGGEVEKDFSSVTLEVSQQAAQYIVTALDSDDPDRTFHLTLVSPEYVPEEPLTNDDLANFPEELVPYLRGDISSLIPTSDDDSSETPGASSTPETEDDEAPEAEETPDDEGAEEGAEGAEDVVEPLNRVDETPEDVSESINEDAEATDEEG